jgi:hypothetical protein
MFKWFKRILGYGSVPEVIETVLAPEAKSKTQTKKKATTKKASTKKKTTGSCDFDKLTKTQLLAEAKHRGVKANASMSKADILSKVKSAK